MTGSSKLTPAAQGGGLETHSGCYGSKKRNTQVRMGSPRRIDRAMDTKTKASWKCIPFGKRFKSVGFESVVLESNDTKYAKAQLW